MLLLRPVVTRTFALRLALAASRPIRTRRAPKAHRRAEAGDKPHRHSIQVSEEVSVAPASTGVKVGKGVAAPWDADEPRAGDALSHRP